MEHGNLENTHFVANQEEFDLDGRKCAFLLVSTASCIASTLCLISVGVLQRTSVPTHAATSLFKQCAAQIVPVVKHAGLPVVLSVVRN
jgi:hypothetical protein